jgi:hypothetical protein
LIFLCLTARIKAADSHVEWRYSKQYLLSTREAATFLAQNLLIVACLLCLSSYELNGLCAIFLQPYSRAPSMAIFSSALRPCLTAIKVAPHDDILFGLPAAPHGGN